MYNSSANPQIAYSLTALSEALFELMNEKDIEEITITQLCARAQIARKTFYRNCVNKMDLVDYMMEKHVRDLLSSVDYTSEEYRTLYRNFFCFWKSRSSFLRVIYRQGLFSRFCTVLTRCCYQESDYRFLRAFLEKKKNPDSLRQFHHAFLVGGLCQMLEQWTREDFATTIDELVSVLSHLVPAYCGKNPAPNDGHD